MNTLRTIGHGTLTAEMFASLLDRADVGRGNLRAIGQQALDDPAADAAGGAGDQHHLTFEIARHSAPPDARFGRVIRCR